MTLNDLLLLLKHYIKWVITVPVMLALLLGGFVALRDAGRETSYSASATLSVADITNSLSDTNLMLLLSSTAQNTVGSIEDGGAPVLVAADDKTQSVEFTATAASAIEAEDAANAAAEETMEIMKGTLSDRASVFRNEGPLASDPPSSDQESVRSKAAALEACVYTISPAVAVLNIASSAPKYALVGFVSGFFAVVLSAMMYDSIKRPIKTRNDVAAATEYPVINGVGGAAGVELARANVFTACDGSPSCVCVVSTGDGGRLFAQQLAAAFEFSGAETSVVPLQPLAVDAKGYFEVQKADATLVCVARWKDTVSDLSSAIEELGLAKAAIVGIVLV